MQAQDTGFFAVPLHEDEFMVGMVPSAAFGSARSPPAPAPPQRERVREPGETGCECPVCREPLFFAYMAPCGHSLCRGCADKVCSPEPPPPFGAIDTRMPMMNIHSPMVHSRDPQLPRCPVCRAALHKSQLQRCYALETAARHFFAEEWATASQVSSLAPPEQVASLGDLRAWKAISDEQAIAGAVEMIWKAVRSCLSTSTAVFFREREGGMGPGETDPRDAHVYCPGARAPEEEGVSTLAALIKRAEDASKEAALLNAVWTHAGEIEKRLEAGGLKILQFCCLGVNYAVVYWPKLGP